MAGIFCLFLSPGRAFAACTITATQTQALTYGVLLRPPSGSQTFGVNPVDTTSGTGSHIFGAVPVHAAYTLKDNGACGGGTISVTLTDTGGASGVTLSWPAGFLRYNGGAITNGQTGLVNPATSGTPLLVGGLATYTSGVPSGALAPTFNIQVVENGSTVNTPETGSIQFDTALSLNSVSPLSLGAVKAGVADNYTISTSGTTSHTGAGAYQPSTPATVGNITIVGSASQAITITAGNPVSDQGVSITAETGSYGAGAEQAFPISGGGPGTGTTLKLGVTVHADGTQADGVTAQPTFNITVVYQ